MESRCLVTAACLLVFLSSICECFKPSICPVSCVCQNRRCLKNSDVYLCEDSTTLFSVVCNNVHDGQLHILPESVDTFLVKEFLNNTELDDIIHTRFPAIRSLTIKIRDVSELRWNNSGLESLLLLNLSHSRLKSFPLFVSDLSSLKLLNMSSSGISGNIDIVLDSQHLIVLDIARNQIESFKLMGSLPKLDTILLNNNDLYMLPEVGEQPQLKVLDLSYNQIVLTSSRVKRSTKDLSTKINNCAIALPSGIESLLYRGNHLWKVPGKECGLLAGLLRLQHLFLEYNSILAITDNVFPEALYHNLRTLSLDHNKIHYISESAFMRFESLELLSISNNQLRHIPVKLIEQIGIQIQNISDEPLAGLEVHLNNNPFSCDCTQARALEMLQSGNTTSHQALRNEILCYYPQAFSSMRLIDLLIYDLECTNATLKYNRNVSCPEYDHCTLRCDFRGLPHPEVQWISPIDEYITLDELAKDPILRNSYFLSDNGNELTILNIEFSKTGVFMCIGNNSISTAIGNVTVGVLRQPISSIVAIVVSAAAFMVAIIVNSINLCQYYCEHLSDKREMRKIQAMIFEMESPLKSKQRGLHESEASINANKYYTKYDFTCQQLFLDTVIKGAHTVKRTLHDARNSEFSNNVWEYAVHLRDRLHIELPTSVQLPRVSMPTISMPNITMPSMPNFQAINTNIEKLGTSVMHRSHNLATSVGSVFTLRWLRSGNSDNESDSEAETGGLTNVEVHVHKEEDDMSSNQTEKPLESIPIPNKIKTTETNKFNKIFFVRQSTSTAVKKEGGESKTSTPRRTKSVRFTETTRPAIDPGMQRSASITVLPQVYEPTAASNKNYYTDVASTSGKFGNRKAFELETTV